MRNQEKHALNDLETVIYYFSIKTKISTTTKKFIPNFQASFGRLEKKTYSSMGLYTHASRRPNQV